SQTHLCIRIKMKAPPLPRRIKLGLQIEHIFLLSENRAVKSLNTSVIIIQIRQAVHPAEIRHFIETQPIGHGVRSIKAQNKLRFCKLTHLPSPAQIQQRTAITSTYTKRGLLNIGTVKKTSRFKITAKITPLKIIAISSASPQIHTILIIFMLNPAGQRINDPYG